MKWHLRDILSALPSESCIPWPGTLDKWGYGSGNAHRRVYEKVVGLVPLGMQLDHLCHTADPTCAGGVTCAHRACVNPAHMEPVTQWENAARGVRAQQTHCKQGHEFTPENTRMRGRTGRDDYSHRDCRACNREAARRYAARKRAAS